MHVPGPLASRDAGLRRVSRVTAWLAAGAVVATGAFAGLAARAHPGRSGRAAKAAPAPAPAPATAPAPAQPAPDLQPPAAAPLPADAAPSVVSGGS